MLLLLLVLVLVLDIARESAIECVAIQDVVVATKRIRGQDDAEVKARLHRIVAMLTRIAMNFDCVAEPGTGYHAAVDFDYEHRFAEHEHEHEHEHDIETDIKTDDMPEPWMQRSRGGDAPRAIKVSSRRPLISHVRCKTGTQCYSVATYCSPS